MRPFPVPKKASLPLALLELTRPRQWPKNLVVFAALLFSGHFVDAREVLLAGQAFFSFVLLSSSVYSFNDARDAENDRHHPLKRLRPVASGRVSAAAATLFSLLLGLAGLVLAGLLGPFMLLLGLTYLASSSAYSLWLKHVVILDVFFLALGFVLRAVAGGMAIRVPVSEWLLVCTTLLALFLGLAKRRQELGLLKQGARSHRRSLEEYSQALLDEMMSVVTSATVVAYSIYTFDAHPYHGMHLMMLTIPFVLYGIFRYLYLVHQKGLGGSPEAVLLTDRAMLVDVLLWALCSGAILALEKRG